MSASTTSRKSITRDSRKFATEPLGGPMSVIYFDGTCSFLGCSVTTVLLDNSA
jgi:hypothetical protein